MKEVAERLNLSPSTVYELCARGELRHIRLRRAIRVPEACFKEFVASSAGESR